MILSYCIYSCGIILTVWCLGIISKHVKCLLEVGYLLFVCRTFLQGSSHLQNGFCRIILNYRRCFRIITVKSIFLYDRGIILVTYVMVKLSRPTRNGLAGCVLIHTVFVLIIFCSIIFGQHIVKIVCHPELVLFTDVVVKRTCHPSAISRIKPACISVKTYKISCVTHNIHERITNFGSL